MLAIRNFSVRFTKLFNIRKDVVKMTKKIWLKQPKCSVKGDDPSLLHSSKIFTTIYNESTMTLTTCKLGFYIAPVELYDLQLGDSRS